MTIFQLKYFLAVAKYGKIRTASEYMHVSGPAISFALKQLEEELEVSLFARHRSKMVLTQAGECLQEEAAPLVKQFDQLADQVRNSHANQMRIQFVSPSTLAEHLLPDLIKEFTNCYPSALFDIPSCNSLEVVSQVASGDMELGICDAHAVTAKSLEFMPLVDCKLKGYVRADHPLAGKEKVTADLLCNENLLMINTRAFFFEELRNWLRKGGGLLDISHLFLYSNREMIQYTLSMVERQNAVVFLLDPLFKAEIPESISSFDLYPPLDFQIGLIRRVNAQLTSPAKIFWEFCSNYKFK